MEKEYRSQHSVIVTRSSQGLLTSFLIGQILPSFCFIPQGSKLGLRDAVVIGGMEMTSQAVALSKRPHVVIATPGRLYDHFQSSQEMTGWFSRLRFLVLDEADRLLDVGFEKEMGGILKRLPQKRQTLLFSATMTQNLRQLQVRCGVLGVWSLKLKYTGKKRWGLVCFHITIPLWPGLKMQLPFKLGRYSFCWNLLAGDPC